MQIPDIVHINNVPFTVDKVNNAAALDSKLAAYIDYNGQHITIDNDHGEQMKQIAFLHEVVHGMMFAIGERDHDEKLVDGLAHQLYLFITSNPAIFKQD